MRAARRKKGRCSRRLSKGSESSVTLDGQTIILEHRFPNEMPERFRSMAAELVALKVDVLMSSGNNAAPYAKNATATIPVVAMLITDPVGTKLIDSIARPGGNVTGLSLFSSELIGKRLQLLKEAVPSGMSGLTLKADQTAAAREISYGPFPDIVCHTRSPHRR